ncbi:TolC family protein [Parafilimonas sp.]|uniref:TolC family protein n=1 Tax=Parafilimonas sp. TaxID=1969739 RepID=UPI0039E61766
MKFKLIISCCLYLLTVIAYGQENVVRKLSIPEALSLALENHQQLKVGRAKVQLSEDKVRDAKLEQLPTIEFSANAYYLSNAILLSPGFKSEGSFDMPPFGNGYALQASQLLYKGGVLKKSVEMSDLQAQLAELDLEKDKQSIRFLVISNYLDILKLLNQKKVLLQNKSLAEQRLANITKLYAENMVTRNEIIRAQLQIKGLEQNIAVVENNHSILSNRMSYALGLPHDVLIEPAGNIPEPGVMALADYMALAQKNNPFLLAAEKNISIAEKHVDIIKTERYPALSAFAGYNLARPITQVLPPVDMYSGVWQAGVALSYNIDNLFKTGQKIKTGRTQAEVARNTLELSRQNVEMDITAAYKQYQEAVKQAKLMEKAQQLANENYKIIEAKYLNQLAITAEMTDAAAAKLDAGMQYANAQAGVLFQYYTLLKTAGAL